MKVKRTLNDHSFIILPSEKRYKKRMNSWFTLSFSFSSYWHPFLIYCLTLASLCLWNFYHSAFLFVYFYSIIGCELSVKNVNDTNTCLKCSLEHKRNCLSRCGSLWFYQYFYGFFIFGIWDFIILSKWNVRFRM